VRSSPARPDHPAAAFTSTHLAIASRKARTPGSAAAGSRLWRAATASRVSTAAVCQGNT
jgi:hypothetical protein